MGNTIEEEIIRTRIPIQTNYIVLILKFLFVNFILVICLYDYSKYYEGIAIIRKINNIYYLEVKVLLEDIKYIERGNFVNIDGNYYEYSYQDIDDNLYVDENGNNNYKYLYLEVNIPDSMKQENYLLNFKLELEKKKIIKYLLEYLGRSNYEGN